jgi:hypothetical protein
MKQKLATAGFVLFLIWGAFFHQECIKREIKWMERHGYSDEEINQTLQSENPGPDNEEDAG